MITTAFRPRLQPLALAMGALLPLGAAQAQTTTETMLMQRLDKLAAELAQVKAELAGLQQARPPVSTAAATAGPPGAPAQPTAAAQALAAPASVAAGEPITVLSSYGEINLNLPRRRSQDAQADVRRFVLGFQHRFDERNKLVTELEVEHAVSSAGDPGEVEVEQAYIEHQLTPTWALRGGLFLVPMGLLNENHEPTAFLGVERNFVETAIIPSTWREGGVQVIGNLDNGLTVQAGLTTGFDLNKWDASSTEGIESPLGAVHQELALAKARSLALFGAVNWRGMPGLLLGGGLFSGSAGQGQALGSPRVTLWDLHARWTPGRWDLSAMYTRGSISGTALLNAPLVGNPSLIPKGFDGWYTQAGYKLWQRGGMVLTPFARWEQFNTGRSYADLGPGLTPTARPTERVLTLGANLQLTPGIVLKVDWQHFDQNRDADRSNLGLGWSF